MDHRYFKKAPSPQDPMDTLAWDIEIALIRKYPEMHDHTLMARVTDCPEYIMPAVTVLTFYWQARKAEQRKAQELEDLLCTFEGGPDLDADDEYDWPHEGPAVQ